MQGLALILETGRHDGTLQEELPAIRASNASAKRAGSASVSDWLIHSSPINKSDLVQLSDPIPHPRAGKWVASAFSTSLS